MRRALVVGLNDYEGSPLSCCANDAKEMGELLAKHDNENHNFDVKLITDKCDRTALMSNITALFAEEADIALFYFSGHGCADDGGYICTTDISQSCYGVKMDKILALANQSKCKNKVIILDCCFSGKMGEPMLFNNKSLLGDGLTIIAASRKGEYSVENKSIGHGVFTNLILEGLKGGAADITGNITPANLYSFVDQSLGAWEQRPVFKANISSFQSLRTIIPKVEKNDLRKLKEYFSTPGEEYKLDPSYEFTNSKKEIHEVKKPYADENNTKIFKILQKYTSIGLVEPVGEEHMYFAAMHSKSCRLTPMGKHYWRLVNDNRF